MTQTENIENHLNNGGSLTQLDALNKFGCFRLASRINDLRKKGMAITTEMVKTGNGKSVASYSVDTCPRVS